MARTPSINWTYELMTEALEQFKAKHSDYVEKRGFLGWSVSVGEQPTIKLSVSELGATAFVSGSKVPKEFEVNFDGRKVKMKVVLEIVPLLPSVAPKSVQKKSPPQFPVLNSGAAQS